MDLTSTPPDQSLDIDLQGLFDSSPDEEQRVIVMIQHPKMPMPMESVYGCRFPVQAGDSVLCPPAPLHPEPFVGVVVGFGDNGYTGPLKYLIRKAS